ncbi:hypothetical protein [Vogesella sp. LIG4]|uniref:hypothetical protein n=1 Tax=Vogesella sp. LIG4 TaxID=1192162 RepID=UPI00138FDB87|nr:hypothetical protein [Vogesella sp. LIG4]
MQAMLHHSSPLQIGALIASRMMCCILGTAFWHYQGNLPNTTYRKNRTLNACIGIFRYFCALQRQFFRCHNKNAASAALNI